MALTSGQKVQGLIYCSDETGIKILGLKRSPAEGGFWQPLTGTVEPGESIDECLIRELQEETGINQHDILEINGPISTFTWTRDDIEYQEYIYAVCVPPGTSVILSTEHEQYDWYSPTTAKDLFRFAEIKEGIEILERILD